MTKTTDHAPHTQVVEAEGHLIDSQLLNVIFDTVIKWDASFEVLQFTIGRTNDEPSAISMRISAPSDDALQRVLEELVPLGCRIARVTDALLRRADRDGCVADDFYSTTNLRTHVRHEGAGWKWKGSEWTRSSRGKGPGRLPQAAGRSGGRRDRLRCGRREGRARVSGTGSPRLCLHDQRDLF